MSPPRTFRIDWVKAYVNSVHCFCLGVSLYRPLWRSDHIRGSRTDCYCLGVSLYRPLSWSGHIRGSHSDCYWLGVSLYRPLWWSGHIRGSCTDCYCLGVKPLPASLMAWPYPRLMYRLLLFRCQPLPASLTVWPYPRLSYRLNPPSSLPPGLLVRLVRIVTCCKLKSGWRENADCCFVL